jgi:hypothetical protein
VRGPNGTTHEKRRAPLAATQLFNIQTGNAKMENAFLPMVKTIPCLEKHIELRRKTILPYHPIKRNSQFAAFHIFFSDNSDDGAKHPTTQRGRRDLLLKVYFQYKM